MFFEAQPFLINEEKNMMILEPEFYLEKNVERVAKNLLGKMLVTNFNDQETAGVIVETEAYAGITDRASHAWNGRRTKRTETMYKDAGTIYVYLIYGLYALFNIVTNEKEIPHAVLIRAIEPVYGIDIMQKRRKLHKPGYKISAGPGLLSIALGISTQHNGLTVFNSPIRIEDAGKIITTEQILSRPRVGVAYAGEDALLPRRFSIKNNPWVSKAR